MPGTANLPLFGDYQALFVQSRPLIDVRAPAEFAKGSLPLATNLPLLNDDERKAVGTCYKSHGQAAAIALGHKLVSGEKKAARVSAWLEFLKEHPGAYLYCWRGGLRSQIAQQWLLDQRKLIPRIDGGFKALRHFLLQTLDRLASESRILLVGGRTGVGKTDFLDGLTSSVDLEGLANHRGSAFGNRSVPQPSQVDFENGLASDWLEAERDPTPYIVMEDEGKFIGRCRLPIKLIEAFARADLVILEADLAQRIARINRDYVVGLLHELQSSSAESDPFETFRQKLLDSLSRIRKRLGLKRYAEVRSIMESVLAVHESRGTVEAHDEWIAELLAHYYDPMYDYQISQRSSRIVASGPAEDLQLVLDRYATDLPPKKQLA